MSSRLSPELGDKIRFKPTAYFTGVANFGGSELDIYVTGTVIYINEEHRYYRVQYETPCCIGHECFKY